MPPRNGVAQINRIDSTVPLSIVFCGSPSRIARPANSEPRPLAISIAANSMPIVVPVKPDAVEIDDIERELHAVGRGAQKDDRHRRRHRRDRHQREAADVVRQARQHVAHAERGAGRPAAPSRGAISASGARSSATVSTTPQAAPSI